MTAWVAHTQRALDVFVPTVEPAQRTVSALGNGHIHQTLRVQTRDCDYVLQRINAQVFPDGALVVRIGARVAAHIGRHHGQLVPACVPPYGSRSGVADGGAVNASAANVGWQDPDGYWWRATQFVSDTIALEQVRSAADAAAATSVFARFVRASWDFPDRDLPPAIVGFHDLSVRLTAYDTALRSDPYARAAMAADVLAGIRRYRARALEFHYAELPHRFIHADCKLNNALLHSETGAGVAVVDLDTAMWGPVAIDFADLVRSVTPVAAEDQPDDVGLDLALFRSIVDGYLGELADVLDESELASFVPACIYVSFMLGVRFATDFLEGDVYFPAARTEQNLDRARTQLAFVQQLTERSGELAEIVGAGR